MVVEEGEIVKQGDLLGFSTQSEYDEIGIHVHLKVIRNHIKYDPEKLLGCSIDEIEW